MTEPVALHPCRCGVVGHRTELLLNDEKIAMGFICGTCLEQAQAKLARLRPVFDAMISAGVERSLAGEMMEILLERTTTP